MDDEGAGRVATLLLPVGMVVSAAAWFANLLLLWRTNDNWFGLGVLVCAGVFGACWAEWDHRRRGNRA